jgi:hypothetical protein
MNIKCPNCGLVNFANADVCRRCKLALPQSAGVTPSAALPATSAGASPLAPASSASAAGPQVLGRVMTKHGFKDWFVIALDDSIVLSPESVLGSVLHNGMPAAAIGGLVVALLVGKGARMADEKKRDLVEMSPESLRSNPDNIVIPLSDVRSIEFTRPIFSAGVEFVRRAERTKFEVNHMAYTEFCDTTQRRLPALYRADERTAKLLEEYRKKQQKAR